MARVRQGDRTAFRELYRRHESRVYAYLWRILGDGAAAEDLRQEAFIRLWEASAEWKAGGSVAGYLIRVARNLAFNARRHDQVQHRWRIAAEYESPPSVQPPDAVLVQQDLAARVNAAIEALPERPREVFILKRDASLSYREIAEQLGISPKTVEVHMGRAYRLLREALAGVRG
jgi:RNA polymerase sigma-70 factor (ECF subfamily)